MTFNCETHDDVVRAGSFSTFVLVVFRVVWSAGARAYAAHGTGPGDDDGRRWWSSAAARVHPVAREDDGRLRFCRVPDHTTPQLVANTAERARPRLAVALEKKKSTGQRRMPCQFPFLPETTNGPTFKINSPGVQVQVQVQCNDQCCMQAPS